MAKVTKQDLFESNLFGSLKKQAEQTNQVLLTLDNTITDLAKGFGVLDKSIDKLDSKTIESINQAFASSVKLREQSVEIQKKQVEAKKVLDKEREKEKKQLSEVDKLQAKLNKARSKEGKDIAKVRAEINKVNKENRERAKLLIEQTDAYQDLSKARNEAQKEFKRLAVQFGADSQQAQDALKSFDELNEQFEAINRSAKDGRPFVGRYADAIKEAGVSASNVDKIVNDLVKEQKELNKQLLKSEKQYGDNSKEANDLRKRLVSLDSTIEEIKDSSKSTEKAVNSLGKAFKAFATATVVLKVIELIGEVFTSSDSGAAGLEKTINRLTITIGVFINRTVKGFENFKNNFLLSITEARIGFLQFLDSLNTNPVTIGGVEVFNGQVIDVTDSLNELIKTQQDLKSSTSDVSGAFEGFTDEINEKIEASDKAIDQNSEFIRSNSLLRKSSAELGKEIASLEAIFDNDSKTLIERSDAIAKAILKQEEQNKVNIRIAKNEEQLARLRFKSSTDSAQAEADLQDAISNRIEVESQGIQALNSLFRESDSIERDTRDLRLDFFIDEVETRVDLNNKLIENETTTQQKRGELINKNKALLETAFKAQTDVLNSELESQGKAAIDFNELLTKSNEEVTETVINAFGETAAIRVLEVINSRKTAVEELADSQRELAETNNSLTITEEEVKAQEKALKALKNNSEDAQDIFDNLENELSEIRKKSLQEEIDSLEDGNLKKIELQKELNDILLSEQEEANQKELEAAKQLEEDKAKLQEVAFKALENITQRQSEKRIEAIDEELDALTKRQDSLRTLADNGNKDATESIAEADKEQSQLRLKREKELQRQKKIEAGLAAFKILASKTDAGDKNALSSTILEIASLDAFIAALPTFFDGIDNTGNGSNLDNKGGFLSVLHPEERVMTAKQNQMVGLSTPNELVADVMMKYRRGELTGNTYLNDNRDVVKALKTVNRNISQLPNKMPVPQNYYDEKEKYIVDVIKYQGRVDRKITNPRRVLR